MPYITLPILIDYNVMFASLLTFQLRLSTNQLTLLNTNPTRSALSFISFLKNNRTEHNSFQKHCSSLLCSSSLVSLTFQNGGSDSFCLWSQPKPQPFILIRHHRHSPNILSLPWWSPTISTLSCSWLTYPPVHGATRAATRVPWYCQRCS